MKRSVSDTLRRLERERQLKADALDAQAKQRLLVPKFQSTSPISTTFRRETREIKSFVSPGVVALTETEHRLTIRMSKEMVAREKLAQKEIERKKKCVAPHYSKGPYQYITEGIDLTTLGKKV